LGSCMPLSFTHSASIFFLSVPPAPPCSTLFPYTTLFRSEDLRERLRPRIVRRRKREVRKLLHRLHHQRPLRPIAVSATTKHHEQDRKSTRLNSSHVKISYAVFCLKKKKECTGMSSQTTTG